MKSKLIVLLTVFMLLVSNSMAFAADYAVTNDSDAILTDDGVLEVNFAEGETEKRIDFSDGSYAIVGYTVEQDSANGLSRGLGDTGTVNAYANIYDAEWRITSHAIKASVKYEYGWNEFRVYQKSAWIESLAPQIEITEDSSYVECTSMIVTACRATAHFNYKVYNTEFARLYIYQDRTYAIDLSINNDGVVSASAIRWEIY